MAVLYQSSVGYFVCHRSFSQQTCGRPYKRVLFDIRTPFLKDLEAISVAQSMESGLTKKRKRKRNHQEAKELPLEESTVLNFLAELETLFMPPPTASDFVLNNKPARDTVNQFLSSPHGSKIQDSYLEMNYHNESESVVEQTICDELFILPSQSLFYKSDISSLEALSQSGKTFPLIVMDPPWTNRFVKRKIHSTSANSYRSMENDNLATLPISHLCSAGALVAIWCTNSKTHLDYLINTLLPSWKLNYVATWFWIKVRDFPIRTSRDLFYDR